MQNQINNQPLNKKSIDEIMASISISQPSNISKRRGGRGLRRNRTIHHGQSSFTDRFSFKTRTNRVLDRNEMIDDNQTRPSWGSLTTSQNMSIAENETSAKVGLTDNLIMSPISSCFLNWLGKSVDIDDLAFGNETISHVNKVYIQEGAPINDELMKQLEGIATVERIDFNSISFTQLLNETKDKNCVISILPIANSNYKETIMFLVKESKFA